MVVDSGPDRFPPKGLSNAAPTSVRLSGLDIQDGEHPDRVARTIDKGRPVGRESDFEYVLAHRWRATRPDHQQGGRAVIAEPDQRGAALRQTTSDHDDLDQVALVIEYG